MLRVSSVGVKSHGVTTLRNAIWQHSEAMEVVLKVDSILSIKFTTLFRLFFLNLLIYYSYFPVKI